MSLALAGARGQTHSQSGECLPGRIFPVLGIALEHAQAAEFTALHRAGRYDDGVLTLETTSPDRLVLRLPLDPTKLSMLRKRLENFLVGHGVSEIDLFDLTVAVSEAVANAIEHPVAPLDPVVTVEATIVDRTVVVTVRDTGQWREPSTGGLRGRGLNLISALTDVAVDQTASGTLVTLRRRLSPC